MIHEWTNVLQTALLLTVHFNSALLRVHNPVLRHAIFPVELKLTTRSRRAFSAPGESTSIARSGAPVTALQRRFPAAVPG